MAFTVSLARGVMEAMAGLEAALAAATQSSGARKPLVGKADAAPQSTLPPEAGPLKSNPAKNVDGDGHREALPHDIEAPSPKELSFVEDHPPQGVKPAAAKQASGTASGAGKRQKGAGPPRVQQALMYGIGFLKLPLMVSWSHACIKAGLADPILWLIPAIVATLLYAYIKSLQAAHNKHEPAF